MGELLYTADDHFTHAAINIYADRPFIKSGDTYVDDSGKIRFVSRYIADLRAQEMDNCLINDWNKTVKTRDTVIHAGDFCFNDDPESILRRLNGTIILIPGNHDKQILNYLYHGDSSKIRCYGGLPNGRDRVFTIGEFNVRNQIMSVSHFALRTWNKSHFGAWNLYGHSHSSLEEIPTMLSTDIGVDAHYKRFGNFSPFTFEEISNIMKTRKFVPVDHHG